MKRVPLALQSLLIVIVVLAVGAYLLLREPSESLSSSRMKKQSLEALYATVLPDLDGHMQPLKQWRGKVLVVNYWATWCAPCRDEMPMLSSLQTRFAARDVQFVGIANDEIGKVREFVKQTPVTYPLLIGNFGDFGITADFGNTAMGLPFTIILDREGKLREVKLGRVQEETLVRLLEGMVQDR